MRKVSIFFLFILCLSVGFTRAQVTTPIYSTILKGGHVIDAKNNINAIMDVAIQDGKIAKVDKDINAALGRQIVDAKGMYVTPGLIDIHTHVFYGTEPNHAYSNGSNAVMPDGYTFRVGVTTVVDCGGAGWKSFPTFKKNIIDRSQTRVLSFLNIVGEGMRGRDDYEQDISDMDPKMSAKTALENKDYVVGFKHAHFAKPDWTPIQKVVQAGTLANMPVIIDLGGTELPNGRILLDDLFFKLLRPGDIYTHTFTEIDRRDPIVDPKTKQLKSYVIPAQKRGIIFDVGFGGAAFDFNQAIPALKAGFLPNTMSTDLHTGSMNGAMKDMLNVLSTFLALGMDVPSIISRSTWAPAQAIKREELGNLSVGSVADVAVLSIRQGKFGFRDNGNKTLEGTQRFECEMTIRAGRIVYDLNAIAGISAQAK